MKTQSQSNQDIQFTPTQPLKIILCSNGQPALTICMSQFCTSYAFICSSQSCPCFTLHQNCLQCSIRSLKSLLIKKIIPMKPIEDLLQKQVQKAIDQLSDWRQNVISQIREKYLHVGLSQMERNLLQVLENGQVEHFQGKYISQFYKNLQKNQPGSIKALQVNIQAGFKQFKAKISTLIEQVNEKIKFYQQQGYRQLSLNFMNSKIIKTKQQKGIIQQFFQSKTIKTSKLLYRASQHDFSIPKFFKHCSNIPNTLTICETNHSKKIGGYTPIQWKIVSNDRFIKDQECESFLFSLTQNDKFLIRNQEKAVFLNKDDMKYGPEFGEGRDFLIINKGNQNDCTAHLNTSYYNESYQRNDSQSWKRFTGNQSSYNFTTKEWEVWELQFY